MKTEQAKTYTEDEVNEAVSKAVRQDREFLAQVLRALPPLPADPKQYLIGNPKGLKEILRTTFEPFSGKKEVPTTPSWREEKRVIYFSVTSDGTTGEDWIKRLEGHSFHVNYVTKRVLRSPDFKPTNGVRTEVAVLKDTLFRNSDLPTPKKIRAEGALRKLRKPNPELACLIRLKFPNKEIEDMGLDWIVAMHEPIDEFGDGPRLLGAGYAGSYGNYLDASLGGPDDEWNHGGGYAFAVSSKPTQVTVGKSFDGPWNE